MARRRSATTSDQSSAAVWHRKGRSSISGNNNEQPSVPCSEDSVEDTAVAKLEQESLKCGSESQTPVVSGTSVSPVLSKRKRKPNTIYASDFVFDTTKKSKVQKLELEPGLKQISSASEMKKALLEREQASLSSVKANCAANTAKNEKQFPFALDSTDSESRSCGVSRRGRKPKFDNNVSLTKLENVKSGNLPSSLNLSPRGAHAKGYIGRGKKLHLANTSLHEDQLKTVLDSLPDKKEMPLTLPRKRGRPKKLADEIFSKTDKPGAKLNHCSSSAENRNAAFGTLQSSLNVSPGSVPPDLGKKASMRRNRTTSVENVSLQDRQLIPDDSNFYSVETELLTAGHRKRKKSVDQNIPKSSEVDVLLNLPQSDTCPQLKGEAATERERTSYSADSNLPNELGRSHSDSRVINKVPLTIPTIRGGPPKKVSVRNVTKTCDADAKL